MTTGGAADRAQPAWLLCRAGGRFCALPLDRVTEVTRVLPIEPVASPPPGVLGLCILRGAPVPVLDLAGMLGESGRAPQRLVTIAVAGRKVALAVEAVLGVRSVDAALLHELPPLLQDAVRDTVAAIGALDAELLLMLRAGRLVPDDVFQQIDAEAVA